MHWGISASVAVRTKEIRDTHVQSKSTGNTFYDPVDPFSRHRYKNGAISAVTLRASFIPGRFMSCSRTRDASPLIPIFSRNYLSHRHILSRWRSTLWRISPSVFPFVPVEIYVCIIYMPHLEVAWKIFLISFKCSNEKSRKYTKKIPNVSIYTVFIQYTYIETLLINSGFSIIYVPILRIFLVYPLTFRSDI